MLTIRATMIAATFAIALPAAVIAQAGTATPKKETQAQLQKEAKVPLTMAMATARKEVPTGKVIEHELEREKGKLIWSFDIKIAGKSGTDEVNIDAMTGTLVDHSHESPADEAREAAADAHKAAKKP
ncbi:MAG TPA: PepSY domain-containing protein [Gemmatimonadales bacterium]|jgi:uncharacterized membrane protein YkoI